MFDRLTYALIGLVFGAVLAVMLWWLYGLGLSMGLHLAGTSPAPRLMPWLVGVGGGCALAGFVLKDRVGDLVGAAISLVYRVESGEVRHEVSGGVMALVLVGVVVLIAFLVL